MPNRSESVLSSFLRRIRSSVEEASFIRLRIHDPAGNSSETRLVTLKTGPALSIATREGKRMMTRNVEPALGLEEMERALARGGNAWLETTTKSWQYVAPPGGRPRLVPHRNATPRPEPARTHDRIKRRRLDGAEPWLADLGLSDVRGNPLAGRGDKIRQIERYADLLAHFAAECGWKAGERVGVADMGCGKGYLTFAAWHVLRRGLGLDACVTGVDAQAALVETCSAVAARLGAEGLSFRAGHIGDAELPPLDALIALHACNDATDQAIRRGIEAGARLILVAPCCHKDVRKTMGTPEPLGPLLEHGLFKERFAEWLTDGLRTLALEAAGYRVTVAEFIPAEHTPKNVLIGAVRAENTARREAAAAELARIRAWAGLPAV